MIKCHFKSEHPFVWAFKVLGENPAVPHFFPLPAKRCNYSLVCKNLKKHLKKKSQNKMIAYCCCCHSYQQKHKNKKVTYMKNIVFASNNHQGYGKRVNQLVILLNRYMTVTQCKQAVEDCNSSI